VVGALGVRLVPVEGSAFRVWSGAVVTRMAELRQQADLVSAAGAVPLVRQIVSGLLSGGERTPGHQVFCVVASGVPAGHVWWHLADGAAFVYDADLTTEALDREVACEVATAMAGRARLDGAGEIRMNVVSGDAAAAALAREWGCQPAATQMRRRLEVVGSDPEVADGPVVRLRSMTSDEVTVFLAGQRADYAAELLASRTAASAADAAARADEELTGLLGDGPALARQTLLSVDSQLGPVGSLWLEVADTDVGSRAFVYDLVIAETQRRRGYGQAAMRALEDHCRARGVTVIALSVFGHNIPARRLYDQLGYKATEDLVHVRLDPPDPPDPHGHADDNRERKEGHRDQAVDRSTRVTHGRRRETRNDRTGHAAEVSR